MNLKKILSCFVAAAALCATCTLTACRKEDGDVSDNTHNSHATDNHTNNPIGDLEDDLDHMLDPSASPAPAGSPSPSPAASPKA